MVFVGVLLNCKFKMQLRVHKYFQKVNNSFIYIPILIPTLEEPLTRKSYTDEQLSGADTISTSSMFPFTLKFDTRLGASIDTGNYRSRLHCM